ncbi:MAG: hypothetical protein AUK55_11760 [Syntrophobacteraceae bacterium CG2_30_61_12]|nr:MAG: hypothetical protein AUK55_11760 [Syntrophobacteraceae bacterium CG2_30_61_12]
MGPDRDGRWQQFDARFKVFLELMPWKVREVLLISSPYDAWVMEEDGRLSEAIITEYRGLNLSRPPRLNWVATEAEALELLDRKSFDLIIIMSRTVGLRACAMAANLRREVPDRPVVIFCHGAAAEVESAEGVALPAGVTNFVWRGNTELLLAVIKSIEDRRNADHDTRLAGVRVIVTIEDNPEYRSALLPILYRELVLQAQAVMDEGLNQEHRLLAMRARPKILTADSHESAEALLERFEANILGVISDVRFPRQRRLDPEAGIRLLTAIKRRRFDIPLLLVSAEPENRAKAAAIPAVFIDKNSPELLGEVRAFLTNHLGFGDFVFRSPEGEEVARASNLRELEQRIAEISDACFAHHCRNNDFSRWLFARSEIELAATVRPVRDDDFSSLAGHRDYLVGAIHQRRMARQKGVVGNFDRRAFDLDAEFLKIGTGSLGGKARGLAFLSAWLTRRPLLREKYPEVDFFIPKTLVLTTTAFETLVTENRLEKWAREDHSDEAVAERFVAAAMPAELIEQFRAYLAQVRCPLAVRSSSLLEDAQFRAYAGLYQTYMLANDDPDLDCRVRQLVEAVKLVYASTYFRGPKAFARRVGHRGDGEKMAVIIQHLVGCRHGNCFYPDLSGVAQSYNYYPFGPMKPEEGIATIALGLGKAVMAGGRALRFSPSYPELLPQNATVTDILNHSQREFYALRVGEPVCRLGVDDDATLVKRDLAEARDEPPVRLLAGTYVSEEQRIRDSATASGFPVLTFASVLKYRVFPLADILSDLLVIGREAMGCPVEMEFSVNLSGTGGERPQFALLQIRPMSAREELLAVTITAEDRERALVLSEKALGNTAARDIADILYVRPDTFDPARTPEIAAEISRCNGRLTEAARKYLLIGPGRWGSFDRWLGIPTKWHDISGVGAIVETSHPKLHADVSQGSHFFQNITGLGISYLMVTETDRGRIDWARLTALEAAEELQFITHVRLPQPLTLKVDGRTSTGVVCLPNAAIQ